MKKQKICVTIAICLAFAGGVGLIRWMKTKRIPADERPVSVSARTLGDPGAPVVVVEYSDFQCPACSKGDIVLHEFVEKFPEKIFLEFRYFPIEEIHPQAIRSAVYAECAARQGLFWPMQRLLFRGQALWGKDGDGAERYFQAYARAIHADMDQMDTCVNDQAVEDVIFRDRAQARFRGVSATPTFFVNGTMVLGPSALREALSQHLFPETEAGGRP